MTIEFYAHGLPVQKGSMRAFLPKGSKHPIVTNDSTKTKSWEHVVRVSALEFRHSSAISELLDCPVGVTLGFRLPKPPSRRKKDVWPDKKPDLDKLCRSTLDGLTNSLITDDARIVQLLASKNWADADHPIGCWIQIQTWEKNS